MRLWIGGKNDTADDPIRTSGLWHGSHFCWDDQRLPQAIRWNGLRALGLGLFPNSIGSVYRAGNLDMVPARLGVLAGDLCH